MANAAANTKPRDFEKKAKAAFMKCADETGKGAVSGLTKGAALGGCSPVSLVTGPAGMFTGAAAGFGTGLWEGAKEFFKDN